MNYLSALLQAFYDQIKEYIPVVSFFTGFTWDSVTLKRIDKLSDNLLLLTYVLLLGGMIILLNMLNHGKIKQKLLVKYKDWVPAGVQFFLGGLFSSYVIFYFQSASIGRGFIFILLLAGLLVANEFLKDKLTNPLLMITLYFFAAFSFFIFFIAVITTSMSHWTFIAGGIVSLALVGLLVYILYRIKILEDRVTLQNIGYAIGSVYLAINILYIFNWIPPVPLSMKDSGVYHEVSINADGYALRFEAEPWYKPMSDWHDPYNYAPGDTVFFFASIFAPADLEMEIFHVWQKYDNEEGEWVERDRLRYRISGGRDDGYRGYSFKRNIEAGEWRVDVITEHGRLLGQTDFDIVIPEENPTREWEVVYR